MARMPLEHSLEVNRKKRMYVRSSLSLCLSVILTYSHTFSLSLSVFVTICLYPMYLLMRSSTGLYHSRYDRRCHIRQCATFRCDLGQSVRIQCFQRGLYAVARQEPAPWWSGRLSTRVGSGWHLHCQSLPVTQCHRRELADGIRGASNPYGCHCRQGRFVGDVASARGYCVS
jgi:hypothetical protein